MNKEDLIIQVNKIYQALNTISVRGYGDVKTLGNCLDAMQELAKNVNSYEKDVQNIIQKNIEEAMKSAYEDNVVYENDTKPVYADDGVVPVDSSKPKPERIQKEVSSDGEN